MRDWVEGECGFSGRGRHVGLLTGIILLEGRTFMPCLGGGNCHPLLTGGSKDGWPT